MYKMDAHHRVSKIQHPESTSLEFPSLGALPLNPRLTVGSAVVNPGCTEVENSKEVNSGCPTKCSFRNQKTKKSYEKKLAACTVSK